MMKSRFFFGCLVAAASMTLMPLAGQAQQKTSKACETEWRANKASIRGSGKTKKAFMVECRSGTGQAAANQPAPPPATATTDTNAAQSPAQRTPLAAREGETRKRRGFTATTGAGGFTTEAEAKAHCPGDTVVWANTKSKIYHFQGTRAYGSTKRGAYMCERETANSGYRVAKNEKRPRL